MLFRSNEHTGVVRRGLTCSLETHLPDHANQCINGKPSPGSSIVGKDAKSMVEVPHRYTTNIGKGSLGLEQAKAAIGCALLGRIKLACPREESDRFQGVGVNISGEYAYDEVVLDSQPSQKV